MNLSDDSTYSPYAKLSRDEPNPLRPYYVASNIGTSPNQSSSSGAVASSIPPASIPPYRAGSSSTTNRDFRELFNHLDYGDYLPDASPTMADLAKRLVDQAIWNYTSVLLAQPFEVAKVVLQSYDAGATASQDNVETLADRRFAGRVPDWMQTDADSDSDESDAPSYFMPTTPDDTPSRRPVRRRPLSRQNSAQPQPLSSSSSTSATQQPGTIRLVRTDSVMEVISQLWSKEGAFGIWKGTSSTFIYGLLLKTFETWTRSCLSALLDLPDPTLLNHALGLRPGSGFTILDSASPLASLGVVVTAAAVAGCLLAPIDMVRTR
jgi:fusion and transport protein UGO1